MKKTIIIFIFILGTVVSYSQVIIPKKKGSHKDPIYSKHYFAITLNPTSQSKAITFMIYTLFYDSTKNYRVLTQQDFMSQFAGNTESKANPNRENLFNKHKINPESFNFMWKVRYPEYPFGKQKVPGWAGGTLIPTPVQMKMLKPFGVNHPADMIFGDNLISFFKAISNPAWVNRYKAK